MAGRMGADHGKRPVPMGLRLTPQSATVSGSATRVAQRFTLRRAVAFSLVALVGVLAVEAVVARRRDYPFQPFERIEHRAAGDGEPLRISMLGDSTVVGVG